MNEIHELFERYSKAVFQKDIEEFISLFDDEVIVFDMWQHWSFNGLDSWREMVKGWFSSLGENRDVITFDSVQIHTSGELAYAGSFVRFAAVSEQGVELRFLENRLTWVLQKKGQTWKIIHQHTSGPIDFNTMKVILHR
jgi:ketosteroid isomerase-like protein